MAHTVLILRLMLIITWTTICASAPQLVGLLFQDSSVSEAVLGKPCHTATLGGVCVKREQCGSAITSVGFNQYNPCGPTAGKDVICCGKTTRTADVLDVSLPDVINPEVNEQIGWYPPCGKDTILGGGIPPAEMTKEEYKHYSSWVCRNMPVGRILLDCERQIFSIFLHYEKKHKNYLSHNNSEQLEQQYVNGGFEPLPLTWPWMALLGKQRPGTTPDWQCTGTVIRYGSTQKWIITAAHCFNDGALDIVRLGEHDHTKGSETVTSDHWVEKRVVHPEYSVHTGYHDMALLKLSRYPMDENQGNMNYNVAPICLPWGEKISENVVGEQAYVVGWGATEYSGSFSPILQEGHVTIFNSSICDEKYKMGDITEGNYEKRYPDGIEKHLLCAGHPEGGVDACKGDSGGPLMIKSPNEEATPVASHLYYLTGVVSHGPGCGLKEYPGLYAPLHNPAYLAWIKKVAFNPEEPDGCV